MDGNYYILIDVKNGTASDFNVSDNNFMVDNNAPVTSSDVNTGVWQNFTYDITLTCNDTNSGLSVVNLTIYNVSGESYWTGSAWGSLTWLSTSLSGGPWSGW